MTINRLIMRSALQRRYLGLLAGALLVSLCLWPTDSRGQALTLDPKVPPAAVDPKLELIGRLASSHVYTTFGYIGVVADNAQKGLYTPQRVDDLMREVTVISDSLTTPLDELLKSDLTTTDAEAVKEIMEIYKLLNQEADALRVYSQKKTDANGNEFNRLRGIAWVRVAKLVGVPVEVPPAK